MSEADPLTLSTGHEISLPLETRARLDALVVGADLSGARTLLPKGLTPLRLRPGRAGLVFMSVAYDRIGEDAMEPYDEFGVFVPATPAGEAHDESRWWSIPGLGPLRRGVGAHTVALPVTTEPACALGVEVWGYPKTVADVSIRDAAGRRRTVVTDDDGTLAHVETRSRPRIPFSMSTASFTGGETGPDVDRLRRQPLDLSGRFGLRPLAGRLALGDHPVADRLRDLDPGRPSLSVSFEGTFAIHPNESVE